MISAVNIEFRSARYVLGIINWTGFTHSWKGSKGTLADGSKWSLSLKADERGRKELKVGTITKFHKHFGNIEVGPIYSGFEFSPYGPAHISIIYDSIQKGINQLFQCKSCSENWYITKGYDPMLNPRCLEGFSF